MKPDSNKAKILKAFSRRKKQELTTTDLCRLLPYCVDPGRHLRFLRDDIAGLRHLIEQPDCKINPKTGSVIYRYIYKGNAKKAYDALVAK